MWLRKEKEKIDINIPKEVATIKKSLNMIKTKEDYKLFCSIVLSSLKQDQIIEQMENSLFPYHRQSCNIL